MVFESGDDLSVNLNTEWQVGNRDTSEGTDRLVDIENVTTGGGSDTLVGNAEANILTGGGGDDTLTGGDGADVFRFNASEGMTTDVITDFNREEGDKLELVNDTDDTIADAVITETGDGGSTVTWDELTIVLDVVVTNDDFINPITGLAWDRWGSPRAPSFLALLDTLTQAVRLIREDCLCKINVA